MKQNHVPRIVTIGGGHGQATLLRALQRFQCQLTAIVPVTDDGGCSGILRRQFDMPPPGDARRCLSALAQNRKLATVFERRLALRDAQPRSIGNIVITSEYLPTRDIQQAIDSAAAMLDCQGRVVPVARQAATLLASDEEGVMVLGETAIAHWNRRPVRVRVMGCEQASEEALEAIDEADFVLIGPGSFFTSVLACLFTGDFATAVARCRARKVFLANLADEGQQTRGYNLADYLGLLQRQMQERTGADLDDLTVLCAEGTPLEQAPGARFELFRATLAEPNHRYHSSRRLADALEAMLGLTQGRPQPRLAQPAAHPVSTDAAPLFSRISEFVERVAQGAVFPSNSIPAT